MTIHIPGVAAAVVGTICCGVAFLFLGGPIAMWLLGDGGYFFRQKLKFIFTFGRKGRWRS